MNKCILFLIGFSVILGANKLVIASCRLNVAVQSVMPTKDPLKAVSWWAKREATLQFDTLVRFNDSGEIQPWLARKWQFSKDLKTLTIELRPGLKFTDGSELDSVAVVESLNRFIGGTSVDHGRLSYVKKISTVGKSKIEILLGSPFTPLLYYLATPRAGIAKEGKNSEIIGSGPWIFAKSEIKNSKKIQLWQSNQNYFNGAPLCTELSLVEVPTNELAASFKNKLIDLIEYYPGSNLDHKELINTFGDNAVMRDFPSYDVTALFFTEKTKQSVDKSARQALAKIILDEFRTPDMSAGYSKVCSILPYGMAHNMAGKCNIEQNKSKPDNPRKFLVYTQDDERSAILKIISEITKRRSYILDFKFLTLAELYAEHAKGNIGIHVETLTMQIPEPYGILSMFESGAGENFANYSNSSFDSSIAKAKAEKDLIKRRAHYALAENILLEDAIVIPLVHQSRVSVFSKSISGYNSNSIGPFYAAYDKIIKGDH